MMNHYKKPCEAHHERWPGKTAGFRWACARKYCFSFLPVRQAGILLLTFCIKTEITDSRKVVWHERAYEQSKGLSGHRTIEILITLFK